MTSEILLIICCDTDPDGLNVEGVRYNRRDDLLSWRGVIEGIPRLIEVTNSVRDSNGNHTKISWFLRCDDQINEIYGDYGWALRKFKELWSTLRNRGDEIAWHPHFWRWSDKKESWCQEIRDIEWMLNCITKGFHNFVRYAGYIPSVRMGWSYHNNSTMRKLDELGVSVDLSAVPGLKSRGLLSNSSFHNYYDWSMTPDEPYFPSKNDYRVSGKECLNVLEVPITVVPDPLINSLYGMIVEKRISYRLPKYHLTPLKDPRKFEKILRKRVKIIKRNSGYIGMYFHPTDLLQPNAFQSFKANLATISSIMLKEKVPFRFLTAREAREKMVVKYDL